MALRAAVEPKFSRASDGHAESMLAAVAFRVDVAREHGAVRVCPVGEIDMATIEQLRSRIDEALAGAGRVILDLRETTFLDSAVLHLAVEANACASRSGTEFVIIPGPPAVQRTFDVAGVSEQLPFVNVPRRVTPDAACDATPSQRRDAETLIKRDD
jgi:anti-anti-sigma factor